MRAETLITAVPLQPKPESFMKICSTALELLPAVRHDTVSWHAGRPVSAGLLLGSFLTLKEEAMFSSETS
jgi:hypothetical protein